MSETYTIAFLWFLLGILFSRAIRNVFVLRLMKRMRERLDKINHETDYFKSLPEKEKNAYAQKLLPELWKIIGKHEAVDELDKWF